LETPAVHIVSTGIVSAIGHDYLECLNALKEGQHGISYATFLESVHREELPVGEVKLSNEELRENLKLPMPISRTGLLALTAAREALKNFQDIFKSLKIGVISGNTVGGMDLTEKYFKEQGLDIQKIIHHTCGRSTEAIANEFDSCAFISTINTACSSSVNAIILASRLIQSGKLDIAIAGGTDALSAFTLNGFNSLMILDKEYCRPMDASRKGLNLGEGAAYVMVVSENVLKKYGLQSLAKISGFANTNDSFHQTASSPEGIGSTQSMMKALLMANLNSTAIDYINVHGTGTINNDASESAALKQVFGAKIPAFSSTKSFTGHTLGASGAIETVFSVMAIQHQCLFANLRFQSAIPETELIPITKLAQADIRHVMSNSFGFGGNCSTIILSAN
jgi:3-oxoacyl-(acyl-carrier-protein) synthase